MDNPIIFYDPDGREIKFAKGTSNKFKKEYQDAVKYLEEKGIAGPVHQMQNTKEIVYLKEGKSIQEFLYYPKKKTIYFHTKSGLKLKSGAIQTPALGLLHEIAHALQNLLNNAQYQKDYKETDDKNGNKEEKRVLETVEIPAAQKAGEPVRQSAKEGEAVEVEDPSSNKEVKKDEKKKQE